MPNKVRHYIGHVMLGKFNIFYSILFSAESSVAYLLAWDSDVNALDSNGLSPLHLSIKSAEDLRSSRSVRHLLIKGANRNVRDKQGRIPMDLVNEVNSPDLQKELRQFLAEPQKC